MNIVAMEKANSRQLRKGRFSLQDHVYHVTAVTANREAVFLDFKHARVLIRTFQYLELRGCVLSIAFVVMPDHFHWLIKLNGNTTIAQMMKSVKGFSAKKIGRPIWQHGYHDHGVRKEENLVQIARYIVANPLRKGLVSQVENYPHWDTIYL